MDLAGPGLAQVDQVEGETGQRASSLVKWKGVGAAGDRPGRCARAAAEGELVAGGVHETLLGLGAAPFAAPGGAAMAMIEFGRTDEAVSLDRMD